MNEIDKTQQLIDNYIDKYYINNDEGLFEHMFTAADF